MHTEIFDSKAIELFFGGKNNPTGKKAYIKSATIFLERLDSRFQKLSEAIANEDRTQIQFVSHQLKGGFFTLGGNTHGELFKKLENEAFSLPISEIQSEFERAKNIISDFTSNLNRFVLVLSA
ncbi:MAG: Hpt domain-containing protein [Bacteriovoracia bacterium]